MSNKPIKKTEKISLFGHQEEAIKKLKTGSILCGGVGSGKSLTALAYFYSNICGGVIDSVLNPLSELKEKVNLYIITTPKKRDSLEWNKECAHFGFSTNTSISLNGVSVIIDSWNRIKEYKNVKDSFFLFDEQKLVGYGSWVKSFLKIAESNKWLLLTATPGDVWMDYLPVFIANGFFKNKTDFTRKHVVYSSFTKYPKIDHYVDTSILEKFRDSITVYMDYDKKTTSKISEIHTNFDKDQFKIVKEKRWNPFKNEPIKNASDWYYIMRRVVNSDLDRLDNIISLTKKHTRIIVFYNFNYELDILRTLNERTDHIVAEYNGHLHEDIPASRSWIYLVQYNSGSEGWNCIETNAIVFYSLNYSYKRTFQAMGRIDRLTSPFKTLYYYFLKSDSWIDSQIYKALLNKQDFNETSEIF